MPSAFDVLAKDHEEVKRMVERRDLAIDVGIAALAAAMDGVLGSRDSRSGRPVPLAEDACAAAMRALVGNAEARDDVAPCSWRTDGS